MAYVVILLVFVIIGMACYLEFKNIEIEQLTSFIIKQQREIAELETKIEELK